MRNCVIDAGWPIYMHNWDKQPALCSMTVENCIFNGKERALYIIPMGSKQRDFFVIHDCVLNGDHAIDYVNQNRTIPPLWKGESEIELFGSGNTMYGPVAGAAFGQL